MNDEVETFIRALVIVQSAKVDLRRTLQHTLHTGEYVIYFRTTPVFLHDIEC